MNMSQEIVVKVSGQDILYFDPTDECCIPVKGAEFELVRFKNMFHDNKYSHNVIIRFDNKHAFSIPVEQAKRMLEFITSLPTHG